MTDDLGCLFQLFSTEFSWNKIYFVYQKLVLSASLSHQKTFKIHLCLAHQCWILQAYPWLCKNILFFVQAYLASLSNLVLLAE